MAARVGHFGLVLLTALAAFPGGAIAHDDPVPAAQAEIKSAMRWLAPAWSPAQQAASVGAPDSVTPLRVPRSRRRYTRAQLVDTSRAPDWWPQDHAPMPRIVEFGAGKAMPCALCHLPNGAGEPQNAPLAGLSATYLMQQINAFRRGARSNSRMMQVEASHMTDADIQAAAAYYAALPMPPGRIHVIETSRVPVVHTDYWMLVPTAETGAQALGNRLIETPGSVPQMELRNDRSGYVAYVPPGSIARGRALAAGDVSTPSCTSCHGPRLRGGVNAPALAGRSPTYLARQLVQFALGGRGGLASAAMQEVVAPLTLNDMISLAAYAATQKP